MENEPVNGNPRRGYFDAIAPAWETMIDTARVAERLAALLPRFGALKGARVLDLGCGTGVLTRVLVAHAGCAAVTAVDLSEAMLRQARSNVPGTAVKFLAADAHALPLEADSFDAAFCFSTWPHFHEPLAAAREIRRVLKPGGRFHILHLQSRQEINSIHTRAGGAIGQDLLLPAEQVAGVLEEAGLFREFIEESELLYLVTTRKGA